MAQKNLQDITPKHEFSTWIPKEEYDGVYKITWYERYCLKCGLTEYNKWHKEKVEKDD